MNNNFQRIDRISEEVRREIDRIIRDEVSDPRVQGTWSITRADVARDLRYAKIYVSVLEDDLRPGVVTALNKAAGFIRHELGHSMIIRYSPELKFISDNNIAYGAHIAQVLAEAKIPEADENEQTD